MSKIRGDPRLVALAHDTRVAIVEALQSADEMSTVQIQKMTAVTRYHLYHHLQQLEKAGIVENHRDQGRARWWRLTVPIDLSSSEPSTGADLSGLPEEVANLIRRGADVHWIEIPATAGDAVSAKKMLEDSAEEWGVDLSLPFTFMPGGILVVGRTRN
jgi:DNA-binding transcriptional ArsR family regulator